MERSKEQTLVYGATAAYHTILSSYLAAQLGKIPFNKYATRTSDISTGRLQKFSTAHRDKRVSGSPHFSQLGDSCLDLSNESRETEDARPRCPSQAKRRKLRPTPASTFIISARIRRARAAFDMSESLPRVANNAIH